MMDYVRIFDNVFELNRINSTTEVEGGEAVSIGLDFQRKNNIGKNIVDFKVANVLRLNENNNLPSKSKLTYSLTLNSKAVLK